jgi:amino acid adenylation domain-containing protein
MPGPLFWLPEQLVSDPAQLINLDQDIVDLSSDDLELSIPPDQLAYIIYTSGSTGQPKGITHSHRNLLHNIMNYTNTWHICRYDRLTLFHSCSFSSGLMDIFMALLNGATTYPWDLKAEGLNHLADWLISEEITILNWIPTPFRHLVATIKEGQQFPKLRIIGLGSESMLQRDVALYKQHFSPECILVNRLGSTEAANFCFYFIDQQTDFSSHTVPAGYPVNDKEILLIDEAGAPVSPGSVGEIAIRSPYLSLGYWHNPELTAKVFLADPEGGAKRIYLTGDLGLMRPDGCLEYFGRKDFQVKIRGHRIELSEIEAALLKMEDIKEAVVVAAKDETGDLRLVAYVVPEQDRLISANHLYLFLKEQLPDYMRPAAFILLDSLPMNPNGKLDRRVLATYDGQLQPLVAPVDFVAPATPTEERLAMIWTGLLKVERVGSHDNFFALGGHSLLGTQLMSRLKDTFGVDLPLRCLFEAPTLAELGQLIEQMKNGRSNIELPAIKPIARQPYRLKQR